MKISNVTRYEEENILLTKGLMCQEDIKVLRKHLPNSSVSTLMKQTFSKIKEIDLNLFERFSITKDLI